MLQTDQPWLGLCQRRHRRRVRPATVSVNDDFTASQASITLRATNDELARWVDVVVCVLPVQGQSWFAIFQDDLG